MAKANTYIPKEFALLTHNEVDWILMHGMVQELRWIFILQTSKRILKKSCTMVAKWFMPTMSCVAIQKSDKN